MARQNKAKTTEVASPVVTPIVSAPAQVAATPSVETKAKKVKAVKQTAPVDVTATTSAPVQAETTTTTATATATATTVDASAVVVADEPELDSSLLEKSADFVGKLQQLGSLIASLKSEYKTLEKQWNRDLKLATKQSAKKKRKVGNRAPSGFVKPTRISDELAQFLEQPLGAEMARTEVTRDINKYIRNNNLQDKTNGRHIIPDAKLSALLKIQKGEELTYFNLQRYMSCHFAKSKNLVA